MRGTPFRGGFHDYVIRRGGLTVFPRLVAAEHLGTSSDDQCGTGSPELDKLLGGGLDPATDPIVAALLGARVFHPTVAFLTLGVLSAAVAATRTDGRTKTLGMSLVGAFLVQMALGALNVALLAPIWLQIVHLLMTDLIWIGLVVWASEVLSAPSRQRVPAAAA